MRGLSVKSDFVLVKGGTFMMGSPESEDWRDQHTQARPKLKTKIVPEKWKEYGTIIVGYQRVK